jgi:myo-inositol catabolism protein IolC
VSHSREIGYDKPLFVQPFDHRGSFKKKFFGIADDWTVDPGQDQFTPILETKTIVYRGLLEAIEMGVSPEHVGILVDSEFGLHIQADARRRGIPVASCIEKSGQPVFDFEYGVRWQDHLRFVDPDIVKVLVRHHPADPVAERYEQMARLKEVSDFLHGRDRRPFMFELLLPATTDEEKAAGARYDTEMRPARMIEAIRELQEFGVEPDIWKLEGLDRADDARAVAEQARSGCTADGRSRAKVGCILLGRGSDAEQVYRWLRTAAPVPGWIGFAVGRTNFAEPVKRFIADRSVERRSIEEIARNYKQCVDVWQEAAGR